MTRMIRRFALNAGLIGCLGASTVACQSTRHWSDITLVNEHVSGVRLDGQNLTVPLGMIVALNVDAHETTERPVRSNETRGVDASTFIASSDDTGIAELAHHEDETFVLIATGAGTTTVYLRSTSGSVYGRLSVTVSPP